MDMKTLLSPATDGVAATATPAAPKTSGGEIACSTASSTRTPGSMSQAYSGDHTFPFVGTHDSAPEPGGLSSAK